MQEIIKEKMMAEAKPLMVGQVPFCFVIPVASIDALAFDISQALQECSVMRGQSPEPLPLPWTFVWDSAPKLIASNGATVCVLSTGTIDGAYSADDILAVAQILRSGNGA